MDVDGVMAELARHGVSVLLKADHERMAEGGEPWTILLSGSALPEGDFVRAESETVGDCFAQAFDRLRKTPGDWAWLPEIGA